jgi:ribosomal protein S18 acetylase RimI-like enzyme
MTIVITPLSAADAVAVQQLLIAGLTERWGHYVPSLNPDIGALPRVSPGSLTLVAKVDGVLVGTGTLRPLAGGRGEIVRMSTTLNRRRTGIAALVLRELLAHAQTKGMQEIVLETTSSWDSAIALYTKRGFIKTHELAGDSHFALRLP